MNVSKRTLDDGTMEIVVTDPESGLTELGWVSSEHLTYTKINQLKAVIARKARKVQLLVQLFDSGIPLG